MQSFLNRSIPQGNIRPLLCYGEDAWLHYFQIFLLYDNLDLRSYGQLCRCFFLIPKFLSTEKYTFPSKIEYLDLPSY